MRIPRTGILLCCLLLLVRAAAAAAPDAPLRLPSFAALASKASHTVTVTLDSSLLSVAAGFLDPSNPQDAAARELISGLKGIYVRSYQFDGEFVYPRAEVDALRGQLVGWQQVVSVRGRKNDDNVDIYISLAQGKANGLVIIASEPREFPIVNLVGTIDLQKLQQLQGKFGIPNLPLDSAPAR